MDFKIYKGLVAQENKTTWKVNGSTFTVDPDDNTYIALTLAKCQRSKQKLEVKVRNDNVLLSIRQLSWV